MPTYQPLIPTGNTQLDVDYQNIQDNFAQLDIVFGIDHTLFSNATGQKGYHESIHSIPVIPVGPAVGPPNTPGYAQIYTKTTNDNINTDQQLFYQTGDGNYDVPLTRNFEPTVGSNVLFPDNGYTFLPGGFILQWGTIPSSLTSYSVDFTNDGNINFPTACYSAQAIFGTVSTTNSPTITAKDTTGITITWSTGNSANGYWVAIGK